MVLSFIAICYVRIHLIVLANFNHCTYFVHGLRLISHSLNEDVMKMLRRCYQTSCRRAAATVCPRTSPPPRERRSACTAKQTAT